MKHSQICKKRCFPKEGLHDAKCDCKCNPKRVPSKLDFETATDILFKGEPIGKKKQDDKED